MGLEPLAVGEGGNVPSGGIIMWNGNPDDVPDGWTLCDGEKGAPDLTNRFVVGAGDEYSVDETGGEKEVQLDVNEMPSHNHEFYTDSSSDPHRPGNRPAGARSETASWILDDTVSTHSTGDNKSHENRPPYYALAYIMKLSEDE